MRYDLCFYQTERDRENLVESKSQFNAARCTKSTKDKR